MNPRILALLLAVTSTIVSGGALEIFGSLSSTGYWKLILVIFGLAYVVFYFILKKLIFKNLERILKSITTIDHKDRKGIIHPVLEIENEISSYQKSKQEEIEELKKGATFRREFIADISHELKTPLFAAQGFVHTLLDGAVKDKAVREKFLKKAANNLDSLEILIQDLLSLSQIETGSIKVYHEYFDLHELTLETFEQFESRSQEKDIQLHVSCKTVDADRSPGIIVYADSRLIHQVISNLVSNAIKYSKPAKTVNIMLTEYEHDVEVVVKDQGTGIPKKHQPRIFERFYRVEKSRSKTKGMGGTGLGLAIVKHILEAHNSKIAMKSTIGEGSVFSFKLQKQPLT